MFDNWTLVAARQMIAVIRLASFDAQNTSRFVWTLCYFAPLGTTFDEEFRLIYVALALVRNVTHMPAFVALAGFVYLLDRAIY